MTDAKEFVSEAEEFVSEAEDKPKARATKNRAKVAPKAEAPVVGASSGALPSGTTTYSSEVASGTTDVVTFGDRFGYVTVTNLGTTGNLWVTTNNTAPTVPSGTTPTETGSYVVAPGQMRIFANGAPLWYPSSRVLPPGQNLFGGGNTTTSPSSPGMVQEQRSLAGGMTNPTTVVQITTDAASGSTQYIVEAAG